MTVKLGMFTMPFHHPDREYSAILEEDQEAIVLADRLGFTEAFVGEHFSSWSERITSPLIFFATLISRTTQIRFGTGVINLPQLHPATVAAHAAMFDQLCKGRFIMGIGPGGLVSDLEMFDVGQAELRPQMVIESIETVLKLWAQDPPYEIDGRFWKISLKNGIWPEFKVGTVPRPYQRPHPPIALSLLTPNSSSAITAGERGWIPISGQFFHRRYLRGHWEKYVEGCERVGRRPAPVANGDHRLSAVAVSGRLNLGRGTVRADRAHVVAVRPVAWERGDLDEIARSGSVEPFDRPTVDARILLVPLRLVVASASEDAGCCDAR